jgi:DNA-binding MarR family transcriptional regulator
MSQNKTFDRIIKFIKEYKDIDPEKVKDGLSLLHLHREIEMLSEMKASMHGLSGRQIETLETIFHHPDRSLTPAQLADQIHLTRSAMTSNLDSLQHKGYLKRASHPKDRRMILITLTQMGVDFCHKNLPKRYHDIQGVMEVLSSEERQQLQDYYGRIISFLKEMSNAQ